MFPENIMKRVQFRLWVNTTSSYVLWNNKQSFEWEKLPVQMQVSPISKMVVDDFNGDNYPDVLLGGNNYSYDVGTGYYDSNKGFVLLNKCKKQEKGNFSFEVLPPSESGLLLKGMVGSLLWFRGDTSLLIAGFNRSKATVFTHIGIKR
jgi:enediyne biosynthesis protein E4